MKSAMATLPRQVVTIANVIDVRGDHNLLYPVERPTMESEITKDQYLATGDKLNTGDFGLLAILFDDETEIRVQRKTELEITYASSINEKRVNRLRLNLGAIWARFRRDSNNREITFETPAAIAAIRGTDWHIDVDEKKLTTLVVLDGNVDFFNQFGRLQVNAGEIAIAELGKAPTKRRIIQPKDQPYWVLDLSLEWFNMLTITDKPVGMLKSLPMPEDILERAEYFYDHGDYARATTVLENASGNTNTLDLDDGRQGRADLIKGLLSVHKHRFEEANTLLAHASEKLYGRKRAIANLGIIGVYIVTDRFQEADAALRKMELEGINVPEVGMSRAWFHLYAGEYKKAIDSISEVRSRFPNHARLYVLAAQLYLLIDEPEKMAAALKSALAIDPNDFLAWHWQAVYYHKIKLDPKLTNDTYKKVLELNPYYDTAWNNFGVFLIDQGDYHRAEDFLKHSVDLDRLNPLFHSNFGTLLSVQERLLDAEREFATAIALEPNYPEALTGKGWIAQKKGNIDESIKLFLKAHVVDPNLPSGSVLLGESLYQKGRVEEAKQVLDNAIRTDTNDPTAPLIRSVISQDRAQAGDAIRYARDAHNRLKKTRTLNQDSLASSQQGIVNVGSAYTNLQLNDWGSYYGDLGFSPYSANSYFFRSSLYPSKRAQSSANTIGLLLDPTAVSFPNRYTEFSRTPRNDFNISGTIGQEGDALTHNENLRIQGFARIPRPFSYRIETFNSRNDGFRKNSAMDAQGVRLGLGGWLDSDNYLLFRGLYNDQRTGVPDTLQISDPDDKEDTEKFNGELGYQHRFSASNKLLLRLSGGQTKSEFSNALPFGYGLSSLDLSLINRFGINNTRFLFQQGVFDGFPLFGLPNVFVVGPAGDILGLPRLSSNIPRNIDPNSIRFSTQKDRAAIFQGRHLFAFNDIDFTYGLEVGTFNTEVFQNYGEFSKTGFGALTDFGFGRLPTSPLGFDLGQNRFVDLRNSMNASAGTLYGGGTFKPDETLRLDAIGFLRYFDNGLGSIRKTFDPRVGIAWQPQEHHWLRASIQRELVLPFNETLAPVAAVGLVAPDTFVTVGSKTTDYIARWDAEWSTTLYTFLQFEEQGINGFVQTIPFTIRGFSVNKARIRTLSSGGNLWFAERFGLFARYNRTWADNRSNAAFRGNELPLVPDKNLDIGLTYINPAQIRVALSESYVGERAADIENSLKLKAHWQTNLSFNWQPLDRHLSFTLGVNNLFDQRFELARGLPAPGITSFLSFEYRH